MARLWRDLRGILGNILQIGLNNVQLSGSTTELAARNAADSDYADFHMQEAILQKSGSAFKLIVASPTLAGDATLILPAGGTVSNQTGLHKTVIFNFTQATASPFTIDAAPPDSGTLPEVRVLMDTAAAGGSPTLSIGISGTVARDMLTTENNLKVQGQYVTENWTLLGASPAAIIGTLVASGQTFSGRVALTYILP